MCSYEPMDLDIIITRKDAEEPKLGDPKAACYDLYCPPGTVPEEKNDHLIVPLGIKIKIPEGYHAKIYPRSSLPLRYKVFLGNCVGIIDSGYLDEWKLIIKPLGWSDIDMYHFLEACKAGVALAQVEFVHNGIRINFNHVDDFGDAYNRGGGFGSTGK